MRILTSSDIVPQALTGSVLTIGNFDGVHRGHAEIFRRLVVRAAERGLPAVVVTFEPHPMSVVAPDAAPMLITDVGQKVALIENSGIDILAVIRFDEAFAAISAEQFVSATLCGALGMRHIIIGHDYCFGRGRKGSYATLEILGAELGFTLEDVEPVGDQGGVFSSSRARRMILDGEVRAAANILGRLHCVSGTVSHGHHRGRALGFPTANITDTSGLMPRDGVYAVAVTCDGLFLEGACTIGTNPTFGDEARSCEVFMLDFNGDLYGHRLEVRFVERLRDMRTFAGPDQLVQAIAQDVEQTRMIMASYYARLSEAGVLGGLR